jgi:hypothetical protein
MQVIFQEAKLIKHTTNDFKSNVINPYFIDSLIKFICKYYPYLILKNKYQIEINIFSHQTTFIDGLSSGVTLLIVWYKYAHKFYSES